MDESSLSRPFFFFEKLWNVGNLYPRQFYFATAIPPPFVLENAHESLARFMPQRTRIIKKTLSDECASRAHRSKKQNWKVESANTSVDPTLRFLAIKTSEGGSLHWCSEKQKVGKKYAFAT